VELQDPEARVGGVSAKRVTHQKCHRGPTKFWLSLQNKAMGYATLTHPRLADDGAVLSQGKTEYQINTAPNKLYNISIKNLVEGVKGTYKICRTGAYDRFGLPVVNIAGFSNLTFNEKD
jgi:hypothetical protein